MIVFNNVTLSYNKNFNILSNINLNIVKGQKVLFIGDEHSGVQSVLHIICKQQKISSGNVMLAEKKLDDVNFATDLSVGYLSLHSPFFVNKTVYKNLEYVLKIRNVSVNEIDSKINSVVSEFGINDLLQKKFSKLNLQEQIVVQIARLSLRQLDLLLIEDIFVKVHSHNHEKASKKQTSNEVHEHKKELFNSEEKTKLVNDILKLCNLNKTATVVVATSEEKLFKKFADSVVRFEYGVVVE